MGARIHQWRTETETDALSINWNNLYYYLDNINKNSQKIRYNIDILYKFVKIISIMNHFCKTVL